MKALITRSSARGHIRAPGSKSYTIRAALCAAMAPGESVLEGTLEADDGAAILDCIAAFGADVSHQPDGVHIQGGTLSASQSPLQCRESAATLRFLMSLASTIPGQTILHCAPSLARRPVAPLADAIRQLGVACDVEPDSGSVTIAGKRSLQGSVRCPGNVSSQFLSAFLLAGPRYEEGFNIELETPAVSERYVAMTIQCMRSFGVTVEGDPSSSRFRTVPGGYLPQTYAIEGDWSAASAILALGALGSSVTITGLNSLSLQADTAMLTLLRDMGVHLVEDSHGITIAQASLRATTMDLSIAIDLLPVASALAATAHGTTTFTGIRRARDKESDRVAAMANGLRAMGIKVDVGEDHFSVTGGNPTAAVVSSAGDHRIAMAFGLLGTVTGGTVVEGAECVSKTYPDFWTDLQRLGIEVRLHEQ